MTFVRYDGVIVQQIMFLCPVICTIWFGGILLSTSFWTRCLFHALCCGLPISCLTELVKPPPCFSLLTSVNLPPSREALNHFFPAVGTSVLIAR